MFTRTCKADVSLRDVTIARDGKRVYTVRMTSREGFGEILKKLVSRVENCLGRRRLAFAGSQGLGYVSHEMGGGQMKKPA